MANMIADPANVDDRKCGRNAKSKWSAYGWQCAMIGIPAVRHTDTGQESPLGTFIYTCRWKTSICNRPNSGSVEDRNVKFA